MDSGDDDDYKEVAGTEGPEEASNHDKRPYCAGNEICLLLLVVGLGRLFGGLALSAWGGRRVETRTAYWRAGFFLDGGTPGIAKLRYALRESPGPAIAGAASTAHLVLELDVLSWTRHGLDGGYVGARSLGGRMAGLEGWERKARWRW